MLASRALLLLLRLIGQELGLRRRWQASLCLARCLRLHRQRRRCSLRRGHEHGIGMLPRLDVRAAPPFLLASITRLSGRSRVRTGRRRRVWRALLGIFALRRVGVVLLRRTPEPPAFAAAAAAATAATGALDCPLMSSVSVSGRGEGVAALRRPLKSPRLRPGDGEAEARAHVELRARRAPPPSCTSSSPRSSSESEGTSRAISVPSGFVLGARDTSVRSAGVTFAGGGGERPSTKCSWSCRAEL
jgi:hypothetical protein